jgi:hypothetical protein
MLQLQISVPEELNSTINLEYAPPFCSTYVLLPTMEVACSRRYNKGVASRLVNPLFDVAMVMA